MLHLKWKQSAANAAAAAATVTGYGTTNSLEILARHLLQLGIRRQANGALGALEGVLHEQPHPRVGDHFNANRRH